MLFFVDVQNSAQFPVSETSTTNIQSLPSPQQHPLTSHSK